MKILYIRKRSTTDPDTDKGETLYKHLFSVTIKTGFLSSTKCILFISTPLDEISEKEVIEIINEADAKTVKTILKGTLGDINDRTRQVFGSGPKNIISTVRGEECDVKIYPPSPLD